MKGTDELVRQEWRHGRARRFTKLRWPLLIFNIVIAAVLIPRLLTWFKFSPVETLSLWLTEGNEDVSSKKPFEWERVEATEQLEFHSCYDKFECAKLKLPLDYFNGTHLDAFVSIALVKLPAKVSVNDSRYGGPILLNPGGPGGSGIFMALSRAAAIQTITDSAKDPKDPTSLHKRGSEDSKYFDVIGFDPRGIGLSEPSATCMPDNPSWWAWGLREATEGIPGSSDAALGRLWSMSHAYGHACQQAMYEPDIKKYMTTVSVARDMLEIVEKHAEYVARQISRYNPGKGGVKSTANKAAKLYIPNTAKLQYWGFSYGTYLGSTFASMFPDRVGRVVLDGVVNTDDYSHALSEGSLYDNEKVMYSYYTYCQQAGPELCPLATVNATLQDIEGRVKAIVKSLLHHPLPLYTSYGPEILTYSDVKVIIFSSLYAPMVMFPIVSRLLEAISGRDEYYLYELGRALSSAHIYQCSLTTTTQQPDVPSMAVLCADSEDMRSEDLDTFERHWRKMDELSPTSGSIWSMLGMRCASWKIRALHRHRGAFEAKTSHPILWIANTADPVTPLKSARIMSERFPGSKLLIQDSAGHCSLSHPTPCTMSHIRTYFQTGALPDQVETLCIPPPSPFNLNSTSPESPFYDPSLDNATAANDVLYTTLLAQGFSEAEIGEQQRQMVEAGDVVGKGLVDGNTFLPLSYRMVERVRAIAKVGEVGRAGRV